MLYTTFSTPFIFLSAFLSGISSVVTTRNSDNAVPSRSDLDSFVIKRINNNDMAAQDYYPGFNNTCSSWHLEPDSGTTKIFLVARCTNGNAEVCSAISLEKCFYEADRWIYPLGDSPLNTYISNDVSLGFQDWFPNPCYNIRELTGSASATRWHHFFWECDTLGPGHGPAIPNGYTSRLQDLAMTVANDAGVLACPYAHTRGEVSTNCR